MLRHCPSIPAFPRIRLGLNIRSLQPFADWKMPGHQTVMVESGTLRGVGFCSMQDRELDRLRELLARKVERRRPGAWRLMRRLAGFISVLQVLFGGKN